MCFWELVFNTWTGPLKSIQEEAKKTNFHCALCFVTYVCFPMTDSHSELHFNNFG